MAGFEPTTTTPQCGALPGCATSRMYYSYEILSEFIDFLNKKVKDTHFFMFIVLCRSCLVFPAELFSTIFGCNHMRLKLK